MLRHLSGRTHQVLTAVAVRWRERAGGRDQRQRRDAAPSSTTREIDRYVATGEPFDKAGAYAIQGRAGAFVTRLDGSYSGVMGLPLRETAGILARLGPPCYKGRQRSAPRPVGAAARHPFAATAMTSTHSFPFLRRCRMKSSST